MFIDINILQFDIDSNSSSNIIFNPRLALSKRNLYVTDVFSNKFTDAQLWYIAAACIDNNSAININFSFAYNTLIKCWSEIDEIPISTAIDNSNNNKSHFDVIKYFLTNSTVAKDLGTVVRANEKIIVNLKRNWVVINNASKEIGAQSDGEFESDWFKKNLILRF